MGKYLALFTLVAVANSAWAQQAADPNPWYAGASGGISDADEGDLDTATGFKIYGGYHFNEWLDLEVGYTDLGDMEDDAELEANGIEASALGRFAVNPQTDVFGRIGVYAWDASGDDLAFADDTGVDPVLGFGASYQFTEQLGIRAEYERFYDVDEVDVDLYSLGATFEF